MASTTSSSPETQGWKLNHLGIRVADLNRSLRFYKEVFGMNELVRHDFDTFQVVLLGYATDGGGAQQGSPLAREGVLELIHSEHSKTHTTNASHDPKLGYMKICFTVPDLQACIDTIKSRGGGKIKVLKEPDAREGLDVAAAAIGAEELSKGRNAAFWNMAQRVAFVQDPDEYLIEIVQY